MIFFSYVYVLNQLAFILYERNKKIEKKQLNDDSKMHNMLIYMLQLSIYNTILLHLN